MTLGQLGPARPQPAGYRRDVNRIWPMWLACVFRDPAQLAAYSRGAGADWSFAITGNNYEQKGPFFFFPLQKKGPGGGEETGLQQCKQNPAMGQVRLEYETTLPQLFCRG